MIDYEYVILYRYLLNIFASFLINRTTPPESRAVTASVNLTPGTINISWSGNSRDGNVLEKVSTKKQKSKSARYARTSGSYRRDKPSMLYVTNLTCVVATGLQLPSPIWARPTSYSVAPADCVAFVVVPAGFGALCLFAFFFLFFFAMVSVSVNCLFSPSLTT